MIIPEGADTLYEIEPFPYTTPSQSQLIGTCIVSGFILLLLSDKLFGSHHGKGNSISIGMIIHGASDGISLAASNWTDNEALEWTIFLGIFLHKMPAAFGLSASIVDQADMTKWRSLAMILAFSLSSPVAGFITLGILDAVSATKDSIAPGVLLLISAGTVLYVALCHIIPECFDESHSISSNQIQDETTDEEAQLTGSVNAKKDEYIKLTILVVSLLVPLALNYAIPDD